ncbi:amino acid ABC transporter substrate-binding protein [Nitrogeniibacter mangrovi]|uniref:Amino acid ABC transporter substrate-binding protein n=1 Tax=Nitrogeniibacter mangrovi TaxID=2016596 RepID=A0A6C1B2S6_9RHOO|nr:transporter substrate-binding domain-containing protein [Nitrogeniibacter mangrovi]QID17683.1 amino acid ABC transporter substrate-binding protein [Nitrogeniibacter mangrovi]
MKHLLIGLIAALSLTTAAQARSLDEVRSSGTLTVAIYNDFAPFSDDAKGIDVDIARALGEKLGVKVSFLPFDADESMDDDLRNMVWKGTVLGYGPADMMMHVPTEAAFANRNDKVAIFGTYFRDTLQIARNLERLPELRDMAVLDKEPVGVEADSLGSMILGSPYGGHRVADLHHYVKLEEAFADLKAGKLSAVMALGSQAEAAMGKESGFRVAMAPLPGRVPPGGWSFGLAVKSDYTQLADALKQAMATLESDGTLDRIFTAHGVKRLAP